jgi:flagellar motor switch protein FliN
MSNSETDDFPAPAAPPLAPGEPAGRDESLNLSPFLFPELGLHSESTEVVQRIEMEPAQEQLELGIQIELGRTRLDRDVVESLRTGTVVPLDKQAGRSMEIYVADRLVARGELLVLDGKFCVRVTQRFSHEPLT